MPKENTHLYFSHKLIKRIEKNSIVEIIKKNLKFFYFGSVMPDTFYYSGNDDIVKISETIHGRFGNLTNEMVFDFLDAAKAKKSGSDLAFTFGFLTHCALDMVFHPVIYYLSGNYYDPKPAKAEDAIYLHRHLETYLDKKVNHKYYFNDMVDCSIVDKLSFDDIIEKKFNLTEKDIIKVLKRKSLLLKLLKLDFIYYPLYFSYKLHLVKLKFLLGIFYGNIKRDNRVIPDVINYRDLITGEKLQITVEELFEKSYLLVKNMINAAHAYYNGKLSREEASKIIRGESLNTGKLNCPVTDIKYFYNTK
ncbi:MAG: hypothetical protein US81_C0006G0011 [Parcubacteria group bacterium GW2011_GWE2_38_18]|nr:MAG: hypothetical protein US81_C0006G0011 [Parcubacteria group bacterium GW2011_GWE2_38_18]